MGFLTSIIYFSDFTVLQSKTKIEVKLVLRKANSKKKLHIKGR